MRGGVVRYNGKTHWMKRTTVCLSRDHSSSHSVALKLGKTGRLCVCVAMERSVKEYIFSLCVEWWIIITLWRTFHTCLWHLGRQWHLHHVWILPFSLARKNLVRWFSVAFIWPGLHGLTTQHSLRVHNDVSQQCTGTWPRLPYSFCWNDLSLGSRPKTDTHCSALALSSEKFLRSFI